MLIVAAVGLGVNLVSMRLLSAGSKDNLNMNGAYFEVLSDTLESLGAILAALLVMLTGWNIADPIIGVGIGLFIIPRTWTLFRDASSVLVEAAPPDVDVEELRLQLMQIPGVSDVHDLHV